MERLHLQPPLSNLAEQRFYALNDFLPSTSSVIDPCLIRMREQGITHAAEWEGQLKVGVTNIRGVKN